jgi:hypothetical protein
LSEAIDRLERYGLKYERYDSSKPTSGTFWENDDRREIFKAVESVLTQLTNEQDFKAMAQLLGANKKSARDEEDVLKMSPGRMMEWAKEWKIGPYQPKSGLKKEPDEKASAELNKQVASEYAKLIKTLPSDVRQALVSKELPTEAQQADLSSLLKGKYAQDPVLLAALGMVSRDRTPYYPNGVEQTNTYHNMKRLGLYGGDYGDWSSSNRDRRRVSRPDDPAGFNRSPFSFAKKEVLKDIGKPEKEWSPETREAVKAYNRETKYYAEKTPEGRQSIIDNDNDRANEAAAEYNADMRRSFPRD